MEKRSQTFTASLNAAQIRLFSLNSVIFISSINVVIYRHSVEQE